MFKNLFITSAICLGLASPVWAGAGHDHGASGGHGGTAGSRVTNAPVKLIAGQPVQVHLYIQDAQARAVSVDDLEVVHTQPVHLLINEPGLNDYHHEHPKMHMRGIYSFTFTPQTSCSYRVWVDIKPKGGNQAYIPVDLKGGEDCQAPENKKESYTVSSQGYDFVLDVEGDLKNGEAVFANMNISKDGNPVDVLEPVMGAFAHMVGFYGDYHSIAHIHPMGREPTADSERGGPMLRFHIEPEQAGYLKLFAQVQIDGKQVFAPFTLFFAE
ncbi:MAG: hypothetical protein ACRBDL_01220 [Alphaproteobacteria bacterium]